MKISKLSTREQLLVVLTMMVVVGSAYGFLRYKPAMAKMKAIDEQSNETESKLKSEAMPQAPKHDADELKKLLAQAELQLNSAKASVADLDSSFPTLDQQEVKLHLSQLAEASQLLVRQNESFMATPEAVNADAKAGGVATRRLSRAERRMAIDAQKEGALNPKIDPVLTGVTTAPVSAGYGLDMLKRYAEIGSARPLQRLVVQGSYHNIRYFMNELSKLSFEVTVAHLAIETEAIPSQQGSPQLLKATLVLVI